MQRSLLLGSLLVLLVRPAEAAPLHLDQEHSSIMVPVGYSQIIVEVQPGKLTSVLLLGPPDALSHFAVNQVIVHDSLEEDGFLPRIASFLPSPETTRITISLEVQTPAQILRMEAATSLVLPSEAPYLMGLPAPANREDGYLLEHPNRYQFARPDVLTALRSAFQETRQRFRRDPIGVLDITQWDGRRPAADRNNPHHISHDGGRDVDIALPSTIEPSTRRDHCDKWISKDLTTGHCHKGTARSVDYPRLAFLLGRLIKTKHVDKIFLDAEFIEPTAEAARRLVHPPGYPSWVAEQLQPPARVLRHVAWHTDHVHVRFLGPKGVSKISGFSLLDEKNTTRDQ